VSNRLEGGAWQLMLIVTLFTVLGLKRRESEARTCTKLSVRSPAHADQLWLPAQIKGMGKVEQGV